MSAALPACPVCGGAMAEALRATVLGRHEARLDRCAGCGFLRVRDPHWLAEAYSSAIAATDTGLVERNEEIARRLVPLLAFGLGARDGRFLDAAGGHGLLARMMRDRGFDFCWSDKYCENLFARGFEFTPGSAPCAAVTAFEVMEHLERPAEFVAEQLAAARSETFIFTTVLHESGPPPADWWYYSFDTGQHIAFFQRRTLEALGTRLGLRYQRAGLLHLLTARPLPAWKLRLCAGRTMRLTARWARRGLRGRAQSDHELILRRLREGRPPGA